MRFPGAISGVGVYARPHELPFGVRPSPGAAMSARSMALVFPTTLKRSPSLRPRTGALRFKRTKRALVRGILFWS